MRIYDNFEDIADRYDTILVDVYGVFWDGTDFTPGAKETLSAEVKKRKKVCVLSNSSTTDPSSATKGLVKGVHYTEVVTSGMVLHDILVRDKLPIAGHKIYIQGHSKFDLTAGTSFCLVKTPQEADMIYFGTPRVKDVDLYATFRDKFVKTSSDLYDMITPEPFMNELKYLSQMRLPVISTNPDLFALEKGHWVIRQGTLVEIFQRLGGQVFEYGKPHLNIYEYAFRQLNIKPSERVAMIGDTYRTDIKGARAVGISPVWCLDYGVARYEESRGKSLTNQAEENIDGITLIHRL